MFGPLQAYEERIETVQELAKEIEAQQYYDAEAVNNKKDEIIILWHQLLKLLSGRSSRLQKHLQLHRIFQEKEYILVWMEEVKVIAVVDDYAKDVGSEAV